MTSLGMPRVVPQPSARERALGSPSWRLSGACSSRHRGVYDAERHGLSGSLETRGVSTFFPAASRRTERTLYAVTCTRWFGIAPLAHWGGKVWSKL